MAKFTFICDHSCDLDTHVVRHEFSGDYLPDVLEQLEYFLRGAGYSFNGSLDFVDHESIATPKTETHSDHFYDITRNR